MLMRGTQGGPPTRVNGRSAHGVDHWNHLLRTSGDAGRAVPAEGPLDHVHRGLVHSALLAHRRSAAATGRPNVTLCSGAVRSSFLAGEADTADQPWRAGQPGDRHCGDPLTMTGSGWHE